MSITQPLNTESPAGNPPRTNILGVHVSAVNMPLALQTIDRWIKNGESEYVCVTGVHGVMESQRDEDLMRIHNQAGMVTPDGMPMVWLNWLYGQRHVQRVYGPDLMLAACDQLERQGYRHYLYGGADGVGQLLADRLRQRFPQLNVCGMYTPPFRPLTPEEDDVGVRRINAAEPDIVWVGLSTPKQERWMSEHVERLSAPVLIGVGAAFDFHAGLKSQAPRWMQRSGLEWFYRMVTEPRRLGGRYLVNNPRFAWEMFRQLAGLRKAPPTVRDT